MTVDAHPGSAPTRRRPHRLFTALAILTLSLLCAFAAAAAIFGRTHQEKQLAAYLTKALPGATVTAVDCAAVSAPKGFCEFLVGRNVFYATPDGRYAIVGQVLDLTKKVDLTERRRAEVRGLAAATDQILGAPPPLAAAGGMPTPAAPRPPTPQILKVDLPAQNAIVHNPGAPLKVTAFTDFNCHFCRQLFQGLDGAKDIEITEYPIAILGEDSAAKARAALCARDRVGVAAALYRGEPQAKPSDCAEGAKRLQENMQFAQAHGISGTPMIVRADGATNPGWMPKDQLVAWLRQSAAPGVGGGR